MCYKSLNAGGQARSAFVSANTDKICRIGSRRGKEEIRAEAIVVEISPVSDLLDDCVLEPS